MWRAFLRKEFAISGIDGILSSLYRRVFWVFYTRPALLLYPVLVVAGLGLFFYTVHVGTYPLFQTGGKWYWGVLTFAVANVIVVMAREMAHAFTTKHYGRKVRRGGLLVYFGNLAFFVDTMDIWMEPKKARMAVSWAGPYSGLLVGSLCMLAIAATGFSDMVLAPLLFKVAIWAFLFGALLNLNPLLELDGYFILMDWLEIPMLRRRSLQFVRRQLLSKIAARASFSREEKIFAVFGVLALGYTVGVIGLVLFFWQSRVSSVLESVGGWVFWVLVGLIVVVVGIPLALGLWVLGYKAGQWASGWLYRRIFMGLPANQVAALLMAPLAVAAGVALMEGAASDVYMGAAGGLVLAAGLLFALRVAPWYLGSHLQWFFLVLPWLIVLLLLSRVFGPIGGTLDMPASVLAHGVVPVTLLVLLVFLSPTLMSFTRTLLQGGWALMGAGVASIVAGSLVAGLTTGDGADRYVHVLDLLGYGLVTVGLFRLYQRLASLRPEQPLLTVSETVSDVERLTSAMRFLVEGTMDQFVQIYGRRALQALEVQFNAATALGTARGLFLKNGRMSDNGEGGLLERSQVYAAALSHLFTVNSRIAGRRFVDRELRSLYRLMPWEEREIGDEHLFRRLDWMRGVQRVFTGTRSAHSALLRSLPLFAGLGEEDLAAISDQLRPETYRKGMDIVRQRQPGSTFYVIESGTVEVWLRHQDGTETLEVELGRGDYFGERSLLSNAPSRLMKNPLRPSPCPFLARKGVKLYLGDTPRPLPKGLRPSGLPFFQHPARAATCRCRSRVRALSLDKGDFDRLVAVRFQVAANLDEAVERTELLATMPLFVEVTPTQVKVLASRMVSESLPAGSPIIRQGDLGEKFYVVKAGAVRVSRGVEGQDEVIVGRLGRGEYFGEIALLMKVPRTATVTAETDVELLSLDASSFEGMVRDYLQSSQGLQQASSRRMIQLRKTVSMAYRGAP